MNTESPAILISFLINALGGTSLSMEVSKRFDATHMNGTERNGTNGLGGYGYGYGNEEWYGRTEGLEGLMNDWTGWRQ